MNGQPVFKGDVVTAWATGDTYGNSQLLIAPPKPFATGVSLSWSLGVAEAQALARELLEACAAINNDLAAKLPPSEKP